MLQDPQFVFPGNNGASEIKPISRKHTLAFVICVRITRPSKGRVKTRQLASFSWKSMNINGCSLSIHGDWPAASSLHHWHDHSMCFSSSSLSPSVHLILFPLYPLFSLLIWRYPATNTSYAPYFLFVVLADPDLNAPSTILTPHSITPLTPLGHFRKCLFVNETVSEFHTRQINSEIHSCRKCWTSRRASKERCVVSFKMHRIVNNL